MSIEGSSNFSIGRSHFNNVTGPQHNVIYNGNVMVQPTIRSEECQRTIWDEFTRVPIGKVQVTRTLCSTEVRTDVDLNRRMDRIRRNIDACRTINIARIEGENEESEFLYVDYSGPDASEAFHRDFERFSRIRNANTVQLFGYTSPIAIPALIFYDGNCGLVPVSFVWEQSRFPSLLHTYFSYLAAQIVDPFLPLRELWIEPKTGSLRKGPYVQGVSTSIYFAARFRTGWLPSTCDIQPSLTFQEYNNPDVLRKYLFRSLSVYDLLQGVRESTKVTNEWASNEDAIHALSSLPGTIYNKASLEPIVRLLEDENTWFYDLWRIVPGIAQEHLVMADGSVRISFTLSDMQNFQPFLVQYDLWPGEWVDLIETWLLLAYHIFHQLGIREEEWGNYSFFDGFVLDCTCIQQESSQDPIDAPMDAQVYLFIQPIPRPSDDSSVWDAWAKGRKYFWSFDPFGREEISDVENRERNLGLPSLAISVVIQHAWCDRDAYDTIKMLHDYQGFDATSTDLASSLGFPYHRFEILDPNCGRLEEIISEVEPEPEQGPKPHPKPKKKSIKTWLRRLGHTLRIRRGKRALMGT